MKTRNGLRRMGDLFARRVKRGFGRRGEEGSALIEFALTLPMLFGLIYLGATLTLGMYNLQQLGNATSSTAMAVGSDAVLFPNSDPCAYAESTIPNRCRPGRLRISHTRWSSQTSATLRTNTREAETRFPALRLPRWGQTTL